MPPPPMVRVEWCDSSSTTGNLWSDIADTIHAGTTGVGAPCVSVGFLVHEDEHCLVIVPHLSSFPLGDDPQGSGDMTIPRRAVLRMDALGVAAG